MHSRPGPTLCCCVSAVLQLKQAFSKRSAQDYLITVIAWYFTNTNKHSFEQLRLNTIPINRFYGLVTSCINPFVTGIRVTVTLHDDDDISPCEG